MKLIDYETKMYIHALKFTERTTIVGDHINSTETAIGNVVLWQKTMHEQDTCYKLWRAAVDDFDYFENANVFASANSLKELKLIVQTNHDIAFIELVTKFSSTTSNQIDISDHQTELK